MVIVKLLALGTVIISKGFVVKSGAGITAAGSATTTPYEVIGPTIQTQGFGWGTGTWSGSQNWGEASTTDTTTLEPGNWSLDNYGQILIATIRNGKSFEWDPSASNALTTRATAVATNPTSSLSLIHI